MRHRMRAPKSLTVLGLCALLLGAAGIAWAASGRERSLAIYPAQRVPLTFDHSLHLAAGADCATCHEKARKSGSAADRNLPKHPECESCHDIADASAGKVVDPKSACRDCHPGFDRTVQRDPMPAEFPAP